MKALLITGLATLVLAGCNSLPQLPHKNKPNTQQPNHTHQHTQTTQKFVCNNDAEPVVRRINEDQIELIVDGQGTLMSAAVSGSGERYVSKTGVYGKGGEWHQKGTEAIFTYHDVGSPATCRLK